jgi:hypothetical protein
MIKKSWSIDLEDGKHTVQLEQGALSGNRRIRLDSTLLDQEVKVTRTWEGNSEHEFNINHHICRVVVRNTWLTYVYDLTLDGISVTTGKPLTVLPPMPRWAWLFVVACGLIPVLALGGALPILIGLGAATVCASIAKDETKTTGMRLALCAGVTVLAWILFVVLVFGIAALRK